MPTVALTVPQHRETVTRSVVHSVVEDFRQIVGFHPDTESTLIETAGKTPTPGGTLDDTPEVRLSHDNHIMIRYKENYVDTGILQSVVYREQYPYIFVDPDLGINIRGTYGEARIEMNVRLYFRNKTAMNRFKRILRMRGGLVNLVHRHQVKYEYSLPDDILAFLYDAWAMQRPPILGEKELLPEYIQRCFSRGLAKRTTRDGDVSRLVMVEEQDNITGQYTNEMFYNETQTEDGFFTAEFNYRFNYSQVLGVVMQYPNVIHNQRIPASYREAWKPPPIQPPEGTPTLSYMPPIMRQTVHTLPRFAGGYKVDPTDEWDPGESRPNIVPIVLAPIYVDESDPTLLMNLNEFSEEQLPEDVLDYLLAYPTHSMHLHATPYYIQAFRVDRKEEEVTIAMQPNGTLRSHVPLDPRRRHYLRIAMMTDLSRLSYNHVSEMLHEPERTLRVFQNLHSAVDVESGQWLKIVGRKKITANSFHRAVKRLPTTNRPFAHLIERTPKYYSTNTIKTYKGSR